MARILVIQLARLGDLIQTTPLLRELAKQPEDQVEVLVIAGNERVLDGFVGITTIRTLPENQEYRDIEGQLEVSLRQKSPAPAAAALFRKLDLPEYGRVINLTYNLLPCWLAGQMKCDKREGGYVNEAGEWLYSGAVHVYLAALNDFRELNWFNLVDLWRTMSSGAPLPGSGAKPTAAISASLPFPLPEGTKVALNPGSSETSRRWPPPNFAQLAERLADSGLTPIIVGAAGDRQACTAAQAHSRIKLHNFCGQTDMPQMARLLSECSLLVSVDTGAVHIASCVGTPVVGLYGAAASFRETAPWSQGHLILQAPLGAELSRLQPELVLGAVLNRLGMLEETSLSRDVDACGATAWETLFFPAEADPVGGEGYRPLSAKPAGMEDLFSRALRHALACEFIGSKSGISLNYLRGWIDPAPLSGMPSGRGEVQVLRQMAAAPLQALEKMAAMAEKAAKLSRNANPKSTAQVNTLVKDILRSFEDLKRSTEQKEISWIKPIVHYLDWDFRMMPMLAPEQTFRYHQHRYEKAASMLRQTSSAVIDFLGADKQ